MREVLQQIWKSLLSVLQRYQQYPSQKQHQPSSSLFFCIAVIYNIFPSKPQAWQNISLALLQQPYGTPKSNYFSVILTYIQVHFVPYPNDPCLRRKKRNQDVHSLHYSGTSNKNVHGRWWILGQDLKHCLFL